MGWALSFLFWFCSDLCQNTVVILTEIALFEVKAGYLMPGGGAVRDQGICSHKGLGSFSFNLVQRGYRGYHKLSWF